MWNLWIEMTGITQCGDPDDFGTRGWVEDLPSEGDLTMLWDTTSGWFWRSDWPGGPSFPLHTTPTSSFLGYILGQEALFPTVELSKAVNGSCLDKISLRLVHKRGQEWTGLSQPFPEDVDEREVPVCWKRAAQKRGRERGGVGFQQTCLSRRDFEWARALEKEFFSHLSFALCSFFLAKRGRRLSFWPKAIVNILLNLWIGQLPPSLPLSGPSIWKSTTEFSVFLWI